MTETFEEVLKVLKETFPNGKFEYPEQLKMPSGFPYWRCRSWEELRNACSKCSVPAISGCTFHSKGSFEIEIFDDFIWYNEKYRFEEEITRDV